MYICYVAERSDHRPNLLVSQLSRLEWLGWWLGRSWWICLRHTGDRGQRQNLDFLLLDYLLGGSLSGRQRRFLHLLLQSDFLTVPLIRRVWHVLHDDVFGVNVLLADAVHFHVRARRCWVVIPEIIHRWLVQRAKEDERVRWRTQEESQ